MENITKTAEQLGEAIHKKVESLEKTALDAAATLRTESHHAASCASEYLHKNPLPIATGAFACGIALGYLIASNRHVPTFQERYLSEPLHHASDGLTSTFHRLAGNLKFW
jgi:ElaB/YqjD/DUF883 family membrane-anchored ribosome-binding protein